MQTHPREHFDSTPHSDVPTRAAPNYPLGPIGPWRTVEGTFHFDEAIDHLPRLPPTVVGTTLTWSLP